MKKIISVILCAVLLFSVLNTYSLTSSAAYTMTVTCDKSGHLAAGEIITVKVNVPAGLTGADCELKFNEGCFTVLSYTAGNLFVNGSINEHPENNKIVVHYAAVSGSVASAGTLFTVQLRVEKPKSSIFVVMTEALDVNDNEMKFNSVTLTVQGHDVGYWITTTPATETSEGEKIRVCRGCGETIETVTIPRIGSVKGDINLDGIANSTDYDLLKKYFKGNIGLSEKQRKICDVNNDAVVDAFDMFYLDEIIRNNVPGEFEYTVSDDGTAKITAYNSDNTDVKIPSRINGIKVTAIDNYAFKNNATMISVKLPTSVNSINYGAFLNCTALKTAVLTDSVTKIGSFAFKGCASLEKINIPASVTSINANSFSDCTSLKIYGEKGTYAESYAAQNNIDFICFNYEVVSGNSIKITGYNGDDSSLIVPSVINGYSVTSIYNYAFRNNSYIKKLTLSKGIKTISYGACLNCTSLETVELPEGVTSIGSFAFKGCTKLNKITVPESVTSIQSNSFADCPNVTLYGKQGSYAQSYAAANSLKFVVL